jgi:hypothetical protein
VVFESEAPLVALPTSAGSVVDPAGYALDGQRLPAGATIDYDGRHLFAYIQLPATVLPPPPSATLVVRGIMNVLGRVMSPNSVELPVPR